MTKEELQKFYKENQDFRRYIDHMRKSGKYTLEQALSTKMAENVALNYQGRLKGWTE